MTATGITVNMTPSHPGNFIRSEIIEEFGPKCHEGCQNSRRPPGNAFRTAE